MTAPPSFEQLATAQILDGRMNALESKEEHIDIRNITSITMCEKCLYN